MTWSSRKTATLLFLSPTYLFLAALTQFLEGESNDHKFFTNVVIGWSLTTAGTLLALMFEGPDDEVKVKALKMFVESIEDKGGVVDRGDGCLRPVEYLEWLDLGEVYREACIGLAKPMVVHEGYYQPKEEETWDWSQVN